DEGRGGIGGVRRQLVPQGSLDCLLPGLQVVPDRTGQRLAPRSPDGPARWPITSGSGGRCPVPTAYTLHRKVATGKGNSERRLAVVGPGPAGGGAGLLDGGGVVEGLEVGLTVLGQPGELADSLL